MTRKEAIVKALTECFEKEFSVVSDTCCGVEGLYNFERVADVIEKAIDAQEAGGES